MSKSFITMSSDEQATLVSGLRELLKKHNLEAVIQSTREVVCNMKAEQIEDSFDLNIKAEVSPSKKQQVDSFNEEAKTLLGEVTGVNLAITCVVGAGQKYSTIEKITKIEDGTEVALEHTQGQVLLIDFWATWCPPCQAPMAHNQQMLDKRGAEWKDKNIRIIGISIDNERQKIVDHVNNKKWNSVEHFHRAGSDCSKVYGVRGVPHVMLIDQDGTIVYKGHPATRPNLEEDLDKLANGEKLQGEGICELKPETNDEVPAADAEVKIADGYKELNLAEVSKEINSFKESCSNFQKNEELKTLAKEMARSFCVIVLVTNYLENKTVCKYDNYRVLVGKQEGIDKLQEAFNNDVKGSFEVNNQIRAM